MRPVDVVVASVLLGMTLGYLGMGQHDAAKAALSDRQVVTGDCGRTSCERITWLRTPAMHAPAR